MDFLDFEGQDLYFDDPISSAVSELLDKAALVYPDEEAEKCLMRAYFLEPNHLMVLVALYRYFYYQHRYEDAMIIADRSLQAAGEKLNLRSGWEGLAPEDIGSGVFVSMGLTRFYLLGLKARAYLKLRLSDLDGAIECLTKLEELDPNDQFGSSFMMKIAKRERGDFLKLVHG
jgi:tetratricopeptide (TPR) repeat protein